MIKNDRKCELLKQIVEHFLDSQDFNGLHLFKYSLFTGLNDEEIKRDVKNLIQEEEIDLVFGTVSKNPHIKRIDDLRKEGQLKLLNELPLSDICAYPKQKHIINRLDISKYDRTPYTKRLWLVEPQLTPVYFDLPVLERYYRDARYNFNFHDCSGSISIKNEHYDTDTMNVKDQVFLQTFGIGYDEKMNRVVISYLRYLSMLSSEHQLYWTSFLCKDECKPNSDYYNATVFGGWPKHISIYKAFLREQVEINKLCKMIKKPPLFKKTYTDERPNGFHALLCPTKNNYHSFIHILDKLISENINHDFFGNDIEREELINHNDGTTEKVRIGSLRLLENWLSKFYKTPSNIPSIHESFKPFREIRKIRQKPAHSLEDDKYDTKYIKEQNDILQDVYHRLMLIRLIFSKHPFVVDYTPPEWLTESKIVFY